MFKMDANLMPYIYKAQAYIFEHLSWRNQNWSLSIFLLYDWRESCFLIGSICLYKYLCLPENQSKLTYKLILHENQV